MASDSRELAKASTDDVPDPQSHWGWNGGFPKGGVAAGVFVIISLLVMTIGNHEGRIEDIYLVGFAVLLAIGLVLHVVRKRNAWRR